MRQLFPAYPDDAPTTPNAQLEYSRDNLRRIGAALKQHCEAKLREAKQQIDKIALGSGGKVETEPFEVD